ncbi:MAG: protein-L-isoaspartate O-methyltransferase [Myxococcales bacterium 68-20]|nr:protein-L-isoaspartate(D-aspartate) O-methyltransferase [Myxococcales bacterium]OJY26744.1 MAG: protein-L-isoaspartate O-methyltransferase [Myxococcales bacterium 68-20]
MPNEALLPVAAPSDDPPRARALREYLVDRIVALGVRDARVLRVMREIPRHHFAPEYDLGEAYGDYPLSIGYEATISQPSLVGIMSEALELSGHERVLEIGTGSGYQTALLCHLASHVDSVELVPELAQRAASTLSALGCTNVDIHTSDGWAGWPQGAPYDRVVVTAAPEVLPPALLDQLADRGRLVVPVGSQDRDQRLERWRKAGDALYKQDLGAVRFVPMVHPPPTTTS